MRRALKTPETREEKELAMMQNPDTWPRWPFLPLIRRKRGQRPFGEEGILYDDGTDKFTVYFANLFMLPADLTSCPKDYESLEAVLKDGWEVD